ncbi:Dyp-type peroxidase [Actinophytocola gossypii]|uniref:Dyp-type peroxidase n=1 Tax=Actinophytocola gossypii TaxID=2812003 RepID=A0ABT2JDT8_9PSEU|nr:Dyp-type peroxidase [Actinophytocola gossypii]MCT2585595.1 Dyp-type peroxidase [Actinophytocola gossypii]
MTDLSAELLLAEAEVPQPRTVSDVEKRPLRYSREVQGNVLAAFNKDHETYRLVWFADAERGRRWLLAMLGHISVTADVEQFNEQFSLRRRVEKADPKDMKAVWVSLSLTYRGLELLAGKTKWEEAIKKPGVEDLGFGAEHMNAFHRADALHDVGESGPRYWQFGSDEQHTPHALVVVSADDVEHLVEREGLLDLVDASTGARTEGILGGTLPGERRGHEHFGFKDGVSQPGVRQFHREDLKRHGEREGHPGTELIEPGEFVLGWPKEPGGKTAPAVPEWARNGSFHVLRKLRQDVQRFKAAAAALAKAVGVDQEDAAALMVGRHPDGRPLARPINEFKGWGSDQNDFDYHADGTGDRTPCYSHVRKTNPRAWHNDTAEEAKLVPDGAAFKQLKRHRIIRRGIPYGLPYQTGEMPDVVDRGLLFVAYCASLTEQFEFQQKAWANNEMFNPGQRSAPTGTDPLIGAMNDGKRGQVTVKGTTCPLTFDRPVLTCGAVYAFAPSMSTLRKLAAGQPL